MSRSWSGWGRKPVFFSILAAKPISNGRCPVTPSDLVHFRHRVGKEGIEKIFRLSVGLQGKDAQQKCVSIDTTVQEKNITFPTDLKLAVRIIAKCRKISEKEGIPLRQSYKRTVKQHMLDQRFKDHPKNKKKAMASARKVKTIAGKAGARTGEETSRAIGMAGRAGYVPQSPVPNQAKQAEGLQPART